MKWSKFITRYPVFVAWFIWALVAPTLLAINEASAEMQGLYLFYILVSGIILWFSRKDLLSPPGIFTLAGFLAFGLSLVLIQIGTRTIKVTNTIQLFITDEALYKALVVFLIAKAGFMLGCFSGLHRYLPVQKIIGSRPTAKVSISIYVALALAVACAGALRLTFHLGEAGVQPSIPYAGYFQYILFDGSLLACMWYLAQGLRQSRLHVFLGLALLLEIAITQSLLGWRSGIIQVAYVTIALFWYQVQYKNNKRPYSLAWLLLLAVVASGLIQLGNEVRAERLGGEKEYVSGGATELIAKIAHRSQGTTRLSSVVDHFGPLTLFNDFMIVDLYRNNFSATNYIDRKIYGVAFNQSHGVGTSGPGGPYVGMGMFGVLVAYALLGILYRGVHSAIFFARENRSNILAIVLYSYLTFTLSALLSENFGLNFVKNLCAVLAFLFIFRFIIQRGIKKPIRAVPLAGTNFYQDVNR